MMRVSGFGVVEESVQVKGGEFDGRKTEPHHRVSVRVMGGQRPFSVRIKLPLNDQRVAGLQIGMPYQFEGQMSLMAANGAPGAVYTVFDPATVQFSQPKGK